MPLLVAIVTIALAAPLLLAVRRGVARRRLTHLWLVRQAWAEAGGSTITTLGQRPRY